MNSKATSVEDYLNELPEERKEAIIRLRHSIKSNLPKGFSEGISYGMVGYYVPHDLYPEGYHCDPKLPLPFVSFASQKNFIALYHMGLYAMPELLDWFVKTYPEHSTSKLDMGKSCIRFKKPEQIPFRLIEQLIKKVTVKDWIEVYEKNIKRAV